MTIFFCHISGSGSSTTPGTAQPAAGLEIREAKGMGVYVKARFGDFSTGPNGGRSWKL